MTYREKKRDLQWDTNDKVNFFFVICSGENHFCAWVGKNCVVVKSYLKSFILYIYITKVFSKLFKFTEEA